MTGYSLMAQEARERKDVHDYQLAVSPHPNCQGELWRVRYDALTQIVDWLYAETQAGVTICHGYVIRAKNIELSECF